MECVAPMLVIFPQRSQLARFTGKNKLGQWVLPEEVFAPLSQLGSPTARED